MTAAAQRKKVILVPLDPVHDIGLKMIRRALAERGHHTELLPPDLPVEEVVQAIAQSEAEYALIGRTLGYEVSETLTRLADLADAAGVRERVKMVVGGMAIRPEIAAEMGFDAGFGPGTPVEEVVAYVEGRTYRPDDAETVKQKPSIMGNHSYELKEAEIGTLLDAIASEALEWASVRTSPGVERARIRKEMFEVERGEGQDSQRYRHLRDAYLMLCDPTVAASHRNEPVLKTRPISEDERERLRAFVEDDHSTPVKSMRGGVARPAVFVQYGTGCPTMDVAHIRLCEAWGAEGVVHFDPSWAARKEGLLEGYLTHEEDGTLITPQNLSLIRSGLRNHTLWQVRAHRGLNTAETVVLAGEIGADLTKINIAYGSLGGGTDPERLAVDAVEAMRHAAHYGLPFDVVTNEELCGVPAHKAFAGMLIVASMAKKLGARPILQPLFCYSPQVMIEGQMKDNYVDFNAAKVLALRSIIDAPIWPGAPIGFLTHSEDRVQSATSTALHACLAASLGVEAMTIASSDEAYSGGPISSAARVDTLRAVGEGLRFFGQARISPTERAEVWADRLVEDIREVLRAVYERGSFVLAIYEGLLGTREDGAYPGRAGRGTVRPV